ncbi:hypothetical protein [Comamonas odontotermitis]|uniref:hypothetical protein n=1 Tax=Comamonas odontotermitis TaxID=379895 RepID=UPI003752CF2E
MAQRYGWPRLPDNSGIGEYSAWMSREGGAGDKRLGWVFESRQTPCDMNLIRMILFETIYFIIIIVVSFVEHNDLRNVSFKQGWPIVFNESIRLQTPDVAVNVVSPAHTHLYGSSGLPRWGGREGSLQMRDPTTTAATAA